MVSEEKVPTEGFKDWGGERVVETTAEVVENEPDTSLIAAEQLALLVGRACGRSAKGNLTAKPTIPPELLAAQAPVIREAIRQTMPPSWPKVLPQLNQRLETLDANDLRLLLVVAMSYYALGRVQGRIEERAEIEQTIGG